MLDSDTPKPFNNIVFLNLLPIIINILMLPLWASKNETLLSYISLILLFINTLTIPAYLVAFNAKYSIEKGKKICIDKIFLMLLSAETCNVIGYLGWGISGGDIFNPDWRTRCSAQLEALVSATIIVGGGIITQIILIVKYIKQKKQQRINNNHPNSN